MDRSWLYSPSIWKPNMAIPFAYTFTYTHTLAQNCHCEFCCGVHLTCKNKSSYTWQEQEGVWCGVTGKFFRRHLEEWNQINRSQEKLRNISRKLEWTRDSPQSQIAPTVQKIKDKSPSSVHVLNSKILMWFSLKNGIVVLGLATPHHDSKIAGTFAQQLGWAFVGPCHQSAYGPPAKLRSFTSLQMVHTHAPQQRGFLRLRQMRWRWRWKGNGNEMTMEMRWQLLNRDTRRGTQKRRGKRENTNTNTPSPD